MLCCCCLIRWCYGFSWCGGVCWERGLEGGKRGVGRVDFVKMEFSEGE